MQCRQVAAVGQPLQHVADVADERIGERRHVEPSLAIQDLQPTDCILLQQREQSIVGVRADTPAFARSFVGRIAEDPEEHGRIGGEVLLKIIGSADCSPSAISDNTCWPAASSALM